MNPLASHWTLDPGTDYLDHGSFGACPSAVLEFQAETRRREAAALDADGVMDLFHRRHGIETWLYPWPCAGGRLLRVSAQIYNDEAQFRRLAAAARELLAG